MTSEATHTIWWIKKDFRLSDNSALHNALLCGQPIIPLFVIEPSALAAPETSAFHVAAWVDAARALRAKLRSVGGELCILRGEVIEVLERLRAVCHFDRMISHEEIGSDRTYQRDLKVADWCGEHGVQWVELMQTGVFRRLRDRDKRSERWKQWMAVDPLSRPAEEQLRLISVPRSVMELRDGATRRLSIGSLEFEMSATAKRHRQRVTEADAEKTLSDFLHNRGLGYSGGISSPTSAFTAGSRLSVHLAWGTITGRSVYAALQSRLAELKGDDHADAPRWRRSLNAFRSRLHWRDHFIQRLETEPTMEFHSLNRAYDQLPTTDDAKLLDCWCDGRTGFPLVDACIRCAQTTGFLNFRMRCMITSVACHALRLDWKDIMWPMARWWADYEPGIHIAQLQMQAGAVGINTLRTYNPAKQIADHDPQARFIKRWVPELKGVSADDIIAHQDQPTRRYIRPVVAWKESTAAMRADYYAIRRMPETKELAKSVLEKHGSRKKPAARRKKPSSTSGRRSKTK